MAEWMEPERAFRLLSEVAFCPGRHEEFERLRDRTGAGKQLEQMMLILASQHAAGRVADLPVADSVKRLLREEFDFFAHPPAMWVPHFRIEDLRYREMARVATFQRFPAGQFEWQVGEFRRSWIFQSNRKCRLMLHLFGKMGGRAPLFEMHVHERRKSRLILLEKQANISYYRVARSIEKQPEVRGVMLRSWLFSEATARVTPRLAWLREIPLEAGASIFDLGEAPPVTGFLTGSEARRRLYVEGIYRPMMACVLWPRQALIDWASRHPEFDG